MIHASWSSVNISAVKLIAFLYIEMGDFNRSYPKVRLEYDSGVSNLEGLSTHLLWSLRDGARGSHPFVPQSHRCETAENSEFFLKKLGGKSRN
jgi:hypothetical protein